MDLMAHGQMLRQARKAVGFSQEELARRVGVGQSTLARWESGESELSAVYLRPLAQALRLTLDQVIPTSARHETEQESDERMGLLLIQQVSTLVAERKLSGKNSRLVLDLLKAISD